MGRCEFGCIGRGMTEREALEDARRNAMDEYGHQDGYSGTINSAVGTIHSKCIKKPFKGKRVKVEKNPQKGAKKWVTAYRIEPVWSSSNAHSAVLKDVTQKVAMDKAKELAHEYSTEYEVNICKVLVSGSTRIANVKPAKVQRGEWQFWGEARE